MRIFVTPKKSGSHHVAATRSQTSTALSTPRHVLALSLPSALLNLGWKKCAPWNEHYHIYTTFDNIIIHVYIAYSPLFLQIKMALIAPQPNVKPFSFSLHATVACRRISSIYYNNNVTNTNATTSTTSRRNIYSKRICAIQKATSSSDESCFGRIILSDVVVKRRTKVYWGRKWTLYDVATAGVVVAMHLLCVFAPFVFNWGAFCVAMGLYVVTGLLGITLSFHRNLSHRSFKLPKWLEYMFAYCGAQALQGSPIDWVSTHRYHHQFCDSERDPHSPIEGFWYSHMSWLFDTNNVLERCGKPNNVVDLEKQPFYRFLQSTYIIHPILFGALLYSLGGFPFIVWGMGVRIVWVYHITWLVNSACHVWGKQAWNTGDLSRNNWWVALLAFGEGWHNNHHAFEYSARHGLAWWQLDMTWYVVRLLQVIGLATDVKVPTQSQKQRMALNNGSIAF